MLTITGDFYLVIYRKWDVNKLLHQFFHVVGFLTLALNIQHENELH